MLKADKSGANFLVDAVYHPAKIRGDLFKRGYEKSAFIRQASFIKTYISLQGILNKNSGIFNDKRANHVFRPAFPGTKIGMWLSAHG